MSRITIVIDDDLIRKLRDIQARQIRNFAKSVSFSNVIGQVLQKGLKK